MDYFKVGLLLILLSGYSFSQTKDLDFNNYLDCFGQHDSTWGGFSITLKKLSSGKIMGTLLKSPLFKKDYYSDLFEVTKLGNTYSNKKHGIEFTLYEDGYSGSILAEASMEKYSVMSTLICTKEDDLSYQLKYTHGVDLRNLKKLSNLKK